MFLVFQTHYPICELAIRGMPIHKKSQKPITIEYARAKLGKKAENMTDKQIQDILNMLRLICNKTIDAVVGENHT